MNITNNKIIIILLLIASAIYYLPIIKSPLAPYDEAVIIVGAERVMKGQVPYKDFFTVYGPAQVYTLAALFKIFGISVTIERVYDIIVKSFLSLLVFLIIRQLSSNKTAIVGWVMSLVWIEYSYFHAYPVYPAVLFTLLCVYLLLFHMKQGRLLYIVLSAISIVMATLFRHDLGGLAALAVAIALLIRKIIGAERSWIPLIYYISAGLIAALPVIVYFYLNSDITSIINDLIIFPLNMIGVQQKLPYPALSRWNLPFYVFPSVLLVGVVTFVILIKCKTDDALAYGILFITVVGIVFLNQVWGRSDTIHLLPVALSGIVLSPILLYALSRILSLNATWNRLFFVLFIIFFGITLSKAISKKIQFLPSNYKIEIVNPDIERAKYPFISPDIKKVVSYIKKNTTIDDYIYTGVINHDRLVSNDPIFYFLAERNCATKYHELNPGHTSTSKIQEEMTEELQDKAASLIVLTRRQSFEPNQSSVDTKIDLLDNYIMSNYQHKVTYGLYEIWTRKL